jgi:chorismate lyase/3-hydroxybenzoate synthase
MSQPSSEINDVERDVATLPALAVSYSDRVSVDSDVLAVLGFGRAASLDHPRFFRVHLEPLNENAPRFEVWRARGEVHHGRDGDVQWMSDGEYSMAAIELDEASHGGVTEATRRAYTSLVAWVRASATPHFLRIWNYFDAINEGEGDQERYRQFCSGRAAGLGPSFAGNYPAASAIGSRNDIKRVQVYAIAARVPGTAVENPRQWSAWRYPRQYGPTAPGFARGMRAPTHSPQLYISGTAAVVGHASHHADDIDAQLDETMKNLESLLQSAQSKTPLGHGAGDILKVYVRNAEHAALIESKLRERLGAKVPMVLLHGDICRAELLLEIDGLHTG